MSKQLVICQVLHSLNVGGAEVLASRIAQRLRDIYSFHFVCLDEIGPLGNELLNQGFSVELIGRRPGIDMTSVRRLRSYVQSNAVDVIHAHQYTPFAYSLLARPFSSRPPVMFNEHGRFHPDFRNRKRVVFNRLMMRRYDRVVAVGNSVRQALIANEGIPARRIQVIHNGITLCDRPAEPQERMEIRAELGANDHHFVVFQVARLDPIKDHLTALHVVKKVVAKFPNLRLIIVGAGPERETIEAAISELQIQEFVRLLGERRDIPRLLSGGDAFLLTSLSEGIPVTIIEAMGARLAVVSTDVGGVREVVECGVTGLLAKVGDVVGLATQLERLMVDTPLRIGLGSAGRSHAERNFSEEQMHAAYSETYCEMAKYRQA